MRIRVRHWDVGHGNGGKDSISIKENFSSALDVRCSTEQVLSPFQTESLAESMLGVASLQRALEAQVCVFGITTAHIIQRSLFWASRTP